MRRNVATLLGFALLGAGTDFLFNGVAVRVIFHAEFTEQWMFVYLPLDFAVIMLSTGGLFRAKNYGLAWSSCGVFLIGAALAHWILVDHHSTRRYSMTLVSDAPVLLRSEDWPQVLFVTGSSARKETIGGSSDGKVQVLADVTTDYGCVRSHFIHTVGGLDVLSDGGINWVWRLNKNSPRLERDGPGMEDWPFPWCRHFVKLKLQEDGPPTDRPWDPVLEKPGLATPRSAQ